MEPAPPNGEKDYDLFNAGKQPVGYSKGTFLTSACGVASMLLAFNAAYAAAGRIGGFFEPPKEAGLAFSTRAPSSDPPTRNSSWTCRATLPQLGPRRDPASCRRQWGHTRKERVEEGAWRQHVVQ